MSGTTHVELNIGVVGLRFGGLIARLLAQGEARGLFRLAAVCDQVEERATKTAETHGVRAYTRLDDLLADPAIPAVALFSGPVGRAELIRRIIRAGKDVMTTKPFERDPQKALEVLEEAKSLGRVVHLNSPGAQPNATMRQVRAWDAQYGLGRPVAARMNMWRLSKEKADGSWYDDPDLCPVAPIFRLGIYFINEEASLFGEPEAVQVMRSRIFTERPTADNAQLTILYKNGAIVSIYSGFSAARHVHPHLRIMLQYENATIYQHSVPSRDPEKGGAELTLVHGEGNDPNPRVEKERPVDRFQMNYQWDNFRRAIAGEKIGGETTPGQIVNGLKIIDAMARAEKSGRTELVG